MATRKERGWGGHFICGNECRFRRNTLLSDGERYIVVSTVGNYRPTHRGDYAEKNPPEEIGLDRHYETMAFRGDPDDVYHDAMVSCQVSFSSKWALKMTKKNEDVIDNLADAMHEKVVDEIMADFDVAWKSGESWYDKAEGKS